MPTPYITCLMECSVDGRLDKDRWSRLFDTSHEEVSSIYYQTLNSLKPEGNLIGMNTAKAFFKPDIFTPKKAFLSPVSTEVFRGIRDEVMMTAIFDFAGNLAYKSNKLYESNIIVVLGKKCVSEEYLRYLREHEISYTFAGDDGLDVNAALKSLHDDFGLHKLVLEGGGTLNGSFLNAQLIDELVVVLYPGIDGLSGVKSIFEYKGPDNSYPAHNASLELTECKAFKGGIVRLRYKIHH